MTAPIAGRPVDGGRGSSSDILKRLEELSLNITSIRRGLTEDADTVASLLQDAVDIMLDVERAFLARATDPTPPQDAQQEPR